MYFNAHEIRRFRSKHSMLMLAATESMNESSQHLAELTLRNLRKGVTWAEQYSVPMLENRAISGQEYETMLSEYQQHVTTSAEQLFEVLDKHYTTMLKTMSAHLDAYDELCLSAIVRGRNGSPWEGQVMLDSLRASILSAEATAHSVSESAIQLVEIAEVKAKEVSRKSANGKARQTTDATSAN